MKKYLLILLINSLIINAQTLGSYDTSFGTNGTTQYFINATNPYKGYQNYGVAVTSNNSLLSVGNSNWGCSAQSYYNGYITKFTENGIPDTNFGNNAQLNTGLIYGQDILRSSNNDYYVRYGGSLKKMDEYGNNDASFLFNSGTSGFGYSEVSPNEILIVSRNQVAAISYPVIKKINKTTGNLISSFGNNGIVELPVLLGSTLNKILVDNNGDYYLVGGIRNDTSNPNSTDSKRVVIKMNQNGSLDGNFANNGVYKQTNVSNQVGSFLAQDGSSVILLSSSIFSGSTIYKEKIKNTGQIDQTFSNGTILIPNFGSTQSFMYNNMIYLYDGYTIPAQGNYRLVRFNLNGNLDSTYNGVGYLDFAAIDNVPSNYYSSEIQLQGNKLIVTQNTSTSACAQSNWVFMMRRYYFEEGSLSTVEKISRSDIEIFPNPVKDKLFINVKNDKLFFVEIYNLEGRMIQKINEFEKENNGYSFNICFLKSGNYILKIKTNNDLISKKIIKK